MLLPTNEKGFGFWTLRRTGIPNITIAHQLGISRQAVSHALRIMDEKVESVLQDMAKANQIIIEKVNPERGILLGKSVPFSAAAIIFVSEKHGIQVWYEHDGDCTSCQRYTECIELLRDYADELKIRIAKDAYPAKMAEELFQKVKELA